MKRKHALILLGCLFLMSLFPLRYIAAAHALAEGEAFPSPCVALTFDDGPFPETTEMLLDGLKERGVHATFFLIGEQISGNEDILQRMKEEGHQIGNHTFSHIRLDKAPDGGLDELKKTDDLLCSLLGADDYWIRPPWGFAGKTLRSCTEVPLIYWSVDPVDWQIRNSDIVAHSLTENAKDGDILLLHDSYPESVSAALSAIDALSMQGFEFVTVAELFSRMKISPLCGPLYARPDTLVTW